MKLQITIIQYQIGCSDLVSRFLPEEDQFKNLISYFVCYHLSLAYRQKPASCLGQENNWVPASQQTCYHPQEFQTFNIPMNDKSNMGKYQISELPLIQGFSKFINLKLDYWYRMCNCQLYWFHMMSLQALFFSISKEK